MFRAFFVVTVKLQLLTAFQVAM